MDNKVHNLVFVHLFCMNVCNQKAYVIALKIIYKLAYYIWQEIVMNNIDFFLNQHILAQVFSSKS